MKFIIPLLVLLIFTNCVKKEEVDIKKSVLEFGYNKSNTGSSNHAFKKIKKFKEYKNSIFKSALNTMPLYIETKKEKFILISTINNELVFFDIINNEIKNKVSLPGERITSTPIYDNKTQSFFVKSKGKESYEQIITTIDLSGKIKKSFTLNLNTYFKNKINVSKKLQCKTALSFIKKSNKVVFGCSIKSQVYNTKEEIKLYGTHRGVTGAIFSYDIETNEINLFKTSKKTSSKNSGLDTGIYLSGGSFPVINDEILVATGNGPVDNKKNFGCSVLKLRVQKNEISYVDHLAVDPYTAGECHSLNLDMTSSSPVVSIKENKVYIVSKSGVLHIFDYQTMGKEYYKKIKIAELPHYSQGTLTRFNNKDYFTTHWFNEFSEKRYSFASALEQSSDFLKKQGFKKIKCLISIKESKANSFSLLYSGPFRESYIELPTKFAMKLTSFLHPDFLPKKIPKFYPVKDLWPSYQFIKKGSLNYSFKSVNELSFFDFEERSIFLIGDSSYLKNHFKQDVYSKSNIPWPKKYPCETKGNINYNLYRKIENFPLGRGIQTFWFENEKLKSKKVTLDSKTQPNKTSILTIKTSKEPLLLATAHNNNESIAQLINFNSTDVVHSFKFEGVGKFSMPLITPTHFFFPTKDNGIKAFKLLFE
jgi:hypothetical protein